MIEQAKFTYSTLEKELEKQKQQKQKQKHDCRSKKKTNRSLKSEQLKMSNWVWKLELKFRKLNE